MRIVKPVTSLLASMLLATVPSVDAIAAAGEMGTGTPQFGIYSDVVGVHIRVWSISNATVNFPAGCTALILTPGTLGLDTYKIAVATLTTAKLSGMKVRFYGHPYRSWEIGM